MEENSMCRRRFHLSKMPKTTIISFSNFIGSVFLCDGELKPGVRYKSSTFPALFIFSFPCLVFSRQGTHSFAKVGLKLRNLLPHPPAKIMGMCHHATPCGSS